MKKIALSLPLIIAISACVPEETVPTPTPATTSWYKDADSDSYGDPNTEVVATNKPDNTYVADNTDCNDDVATGGSINPGVTETVIDDVDNNCDGIVDEGLYFLADTGPAGGLVFYVASDQSYRLEMSPNDLDGGAGAEWGCSATDITGANAFTLGSGAQNTADILAASCNPDTPANPLAANLVDAYSLNGYNDWFLPSENELTRIYQYQSVHGGGFANDYYWSSSENGAFNARSVLFINGVKGGASKSILMRVRAVRAF